MPSFTVGQFFPISLNVCSSGSCDQMIRVYAGGVVAEMVQYETVWNLPNK